MSLVIMTAIVGLIRGFKVSCREELRVRCVRKAAESESEAEGVLYLLSVKPPPTH